MIRVLLLGLTLCSCRTDDRALATAVVERLVGAGRLRVDSELRPALDLYLARAPSHGHLTDLAELRFGSPDGVGTCYSVETDLGRVLRVVVRRLPDRPYRTVVVLHELAHCLHDKSHDPSDPLKLMFPATADDDPYWAAHLDERLAEVWTGP